MTTASAIPTLDEVRKRLHSKNGGVLRDWSATITDAERVELLLERRMSDGGYADENGLSTNNDGTSAWAATFLILCGEREHAIPTLNWVLSTERICPATHKKYGLFSMVHVSSPVSRHEEYRHHPHIAEVAGPIAAMLHTAVHYGVRVVGCTDALKRGVQTFSRIGPVFRDQYDGNTYRPHNDPALLTMGARAHERHCCPSNKAAGEVAEWCVRAFDCLPDGPARDLAGVLADDILFAPAPVGLFSRAMNLTMDAECHYSQKLWPEYYRHQSDPAPIFGTPMGDATIWPCDAKRGSAGLTKSPRAAFVLHGRVSDAINRQRNPSVEPPPGSETPRL